VRHVLVQRCPDTHRFFVNEVRSFEGLAALIAHFRANDLSEAFNVDGLRLGQHLLFFCDY
jgi:hypothetical protein